MMGVTLLLCMFAAWVSAQVCADGYYLAATGRGAACTPCPAPCATCTSYGVCTSCAAGYALNQQPRCPQCPTGCTTCSYNATGTFCLTCQQGLFLYKGACQACASSQYLLNGVCKACPNSLGCAKCLNATACLTCDSGSALGNLTFTQSGSSVQTLACLQTATRTGAAAWLAAPLLISLLSLL